MAMIEKTECCYVMGVIKGEAMSSLHSIYTILTKHKMQAFEFNFQLSDCQLNQ